MKAQAILMIVCFFAGAAQAQEAANPADDLGLPAGVTVDNDGDLIMDFNFPDNVRGGVNNFTKFGPSCQSSLESAVRRMKASKALPAVQGIQEFAENLDLQVKIATNSEEKDKILRKVAKDVATTSASIVLDELKNLEKVDQKLSKELKVACGLTKLSVPLQFDPKLDVLLNYDGMVFDSKTPKSTQAQPVPADEEGQDIELVAPAN